MASDLSGVEMTGGPDALAAWNGVSRGFLTHAASTPDHLQALLRAAPERVLPHAVRALFCLTLGRRAMWATAREAVAEAEAAALANPPDGRERALLDAARLWLAHRPTRAADAVDRYLEEVPCDAFAMKLVQIIRFSTGDARGMRRSLERTAAAHGAGHWAEGLHLGARAFAWEETGDYDAALRFGEEAVGMNRDDAWAVHAVAHVHEMRADTDAGLAWLDAHEAGWGHCNNFSYHVWWHKALVLLGAGRHTDVLALYDSHVRSERTDDYRDVANASSLLARLMLDGVDVGDRWEELADLAEAHAEDGTLVFGDLHVMLALIGGDRRDAQRRLVRSMAAQGDDERVATRARPGLSLARGLEAFGEGDHVRAAEHLLAGQPHMRAIGGSHAQRDVFERIAIEAALRAGRLRDARRLLDERAALCCGRDDAFAAARREVIEAAGRERCSAGAAHGGHAATVN